MVEVGAKRVTVREAVARGEVAMSRETLRLITTGAARKGDVLGVAQIAGITAAKRTWELIPLCHPIPLTGVSVVLTPDPRASRVRIEARVRTVGRTGAEMEALVAASVASLTVYDMCKAVDKGITITEIGLVSKTGGKSGPWARSEARASTGN